MLHEACALMTGDWKYSPYSWRIDPVSARIYIDACLRHIYAWLEGEENAQDSGVHHLGHARACLAVLLDATEIGMLIDDRPIAGTDNVPYADLLEYANAWVIANKPGAAVVADVVEDPFESFIKYVNDTA